jgi:hypothetical protein
MRRLELRFLTRFLPPLLFVAATVGACSAGTTPSRFDDGSAGTGGSATPEGGTGGSLPVGGSDSGAAGTSDIEFGGSGGSEPGPAADPKTCQEAAYQKSYVGCDFWPTVTPNSVWNVFDFAVVVANAGEKDSVVKVTRGGSVVAEETVPPNELRTVYLPWVDELKGEEGDNCGSAASLNKSVFSVGGAYHLTTSSPVTVYQFDALEYAPKGGPAGKDWSSCPGNTKCASAGGPIGCYSYTNDASLLLPSTAMTGNYRVATMKTMTLKNLAGKENAVAGGYFVVTATQDATDVTVKLGPTGSVLAGKQFVATKGQDVITFTLDAGDVMEVVGAAEVGSDVSGSLVQATKPVQVIAGMPCVQLPFPQAACDHIEESVFPVETLGKRYIVTRPTGPSGKPVPHMVRIYGNVDGTQISFPGGAPKGTPTSIDAGEVIELDGGAGDKIIRGEFEIVGDHEFSVAIFLLGGSVVDPPSIANGGRSKGDPSQSFATAVEQYRKKYVFLAPNDYDKNFVDVVQPTDAEVTVDGTVVSAAKEPIPGDPDYVLVRVPLGKGQDGAHVLEATAAVGIQVVGYGEYTSYQYPGGLNLTAIAPPPPPIK